MCMRKQDLHWCITATNDIYCRLHFMDKGCPPAYEDTGWAIHTMSLV